MIMFLVLKHIGTDAHTRQHHGLPCANGAHSLPISSSLSFFGHILPSTLAGIICTSIYQHINLFNRVMLLTLGGMIAVVAAIIWGFGQLDKEQMNVVSTSIANILLMTIIVAFILAGVRKKINVYDAFIEGAKDGSPPPCASSHISWRYSSASAYSVLRAQWICS